MSAAMWRYGLPTMSSSGTPEKYCRPRAASRSYGCAGTRQSGSGKTSAHSLDTFILLPCTTQQRTDDTTHPKALIKTTH